MIRRYQDTEPQIADSAYVDPEATIIGNVTIGEDATVLPGAVLRADGGAIVLETRANVQDNVTIHADGAVPAVRLEENAAVGHNAIVHNATIGEHALVGMGATVLDEATLEPYSAVGANALVLEGQTVDSLTMVGGAPAETIKSDLDEDSRLFGTARRYVERATGLAADEQVDK